MVKRINAVLKNVSNTSDGDTMNAENHAFLDLFSTSPTNLENVDMRTCAVSSFCVNNAPFFAYKKDTKVVGGADKTYAVAQGNCHSWSCPRCGYFRAAQEYGRIVEGSRTIAKQGPIYFITITCRGKELTTKQAEDGYGTWTNKLLDAWRLNAKRSGQRWIYAQVTERQKRGHPHSHILSAWSPGDLAEGFKDDWKTVDGQHVNVPAEVLRSAYIAKSVIKAGLGGQYDISIVDNSEAASRYVAKYLFKSEIFSSDWPRNWKRVRYSQTFPKLEKKHSDAFVLLDKKDWSKLAEKALFVQCRDTFTYDVTAAALRGHDVFVTVKDTSTSTF